ncbi:DUF1367 family protein [Brucella intermedia]|uniref:DUF1367 family protein n=2 Tax=Brucella/Ochrobactrum group TaxID=2826938 RepID=UPI003AB8AF12
MAALDSIRNGELVKVEIKQFRNVSRHRAYWAMVQEVVDGYGLNYSADRLHEIIKLETGVVDLVRLPDGLKVQLPGSISFDKMSEAEFQAFFKKAEKWLAETYGYVREEVA